MTKHHMHRPFSVARLRFFVFFLMLVFASSSVLRYVKELMVGTQMEISYQLWTRRIRWETGISPQELEYALPISPSDLDLTSPAHTHKYNYTAAIIYLGSLERIDELFLSLSYLHANLPGPPWPIIIFHSGDFSSYASQIDFKFNLYKYLCASGSSRARADPKLSYAFTERVEFEELAWDFPPGVNFTLSSLDPIYPNVWPGYQHMIWFYAFTIFHHPRLQNLTYYLRLDTDSYIYAPACEDPFERMQERGLGYGYRIVYDDYARFTRGMWDFVGDYAMREENGIVKDRMDRNGWVLPGPFDADDNTDDDDDNGNDTRDWKLGEESPTWDIDFPQYYNNFEVVRLETFRRPDVQKWFQEIMSVPERVYKWRWGDAPLRYATVQMFLDVKTEVEEFCGIPYRHSEHVGELCACDGR